MPNIAKLLDQMAVLQRQMDEVQRRMEAFLSAEAKGATDSQAELGDMAEQQRIRLRPSRLFPSEVSAPSSAGLPHRPLREDVYYHGGGRHETHPFFRERS